MHLHRILNLVSTPVLPALQSHLSLPTSRAHPTHQRPQLNQPGKQRKNPHVIHPQKVPPRSRPRPFEIRRSARRIKFRTPPRRSRRNLALDASRGRRAHSLTLEIQSPRWQKGPLASPGRSRADFVGRVMTLGLMRAVGLSGRFNIDKDPTGR